MIDDSEADAVERSLQRYRVAGPPSDLRQRITEHDARPRRVRVREWLPALATAALIIVFYALAVSARAELAARWPTPDEPQEIEQRLGPNDEVPLP